MIISKNFKFIFIAIPKTGTTSITTVCKTYFNAICVSSHGYTIPLECENKGFFVFTVVRNPYDRCVSIWWSTIHRKSDRHHFKKALGHDLSFDNFCINIHKLHDIFPNLILPQSHWLDHIKVDKIIPYENLNEEWGKLKFNIRSKIKLPCLNSTTSVTDWNPNARLHYKEYLTPNSISIINEYYNRDFNMISRYKKL